ncbi:TPA: class IV adenylate cyclase [Vibrio parahaemolyticus]|nr:class IV adenylate cyclase [Vibrio parahaemolyticus]HCE4658989.1 class IV adenylate cyclase [Vibrio parahaemolyticus]
MVSDAHFQGQFEVELKYRVKNHDAFLNMLKQIEYEVMFENNQESDWFYDTPQRTLTQQGKSLVLREIQPAGIKLWIVKGPEADRCEATNITKLDSAQSMLENMGYEVIQRSKKIRSIFFVGEFHITLDFLDGFGHFAEFAIMTDDETALASYREQLVALAQQFHLSEADREHRSYKEILSA